MNYDQQLKGGEDQMAQESSCIIQLHWGLTQLFNATASQAAEALWHYTLRRAGEIGRRSALHPYPAWIFLAASELKLVENHSNSKSPGAF
jgi:hypothetical protein